MREAVNNLRCFKTLPREEKAAQTLRETFSQFGNIAVNLSAISGGLSIHDLWNSQSGVLAPIPLPLKKDRTIIDNLRLFSGSEWLIPAEPDMPWDIFRWKKEKIEKKTRKTNGCCIILRWRYTLHMGSLAPALQHSLATETEFMVFFHMYFLSLKINPFMLQISK